MKIDRDSIVAYAIYNEAVCNNEVVCPECATAEEIEEAEEDPDCLILRDEIEKTDDLTFCDRCKQRIV
jgi:hypothetical protein